jgi:hypothetical protein
VGNWVNWQPRACVADNHNETPAANQDNCAKKNRQAASRRPRLGGQDQVDLPITG